MSDDARKFFDAIARRYDRVYAPDGRATRARMARVLGEIAPASDVLDLGVGTGRELAALLDAGHRVTGVDVSPEMLALCKKRARPIPVVQADFWERLPFPDGAFDAVIALHGTLAHPPSDAALARFAAEAGRVLRPGGALVAEVPSEGWLARLERGGSPDETLRARRVGADRFVHEDLAAGASIEGRVLSEAAWRALFAAWPITVEPLGDAEALVVARRAVG